jgi:three-Cys-motif partner protein
MNDFGGKWTNAKIEVFIKYLKAYMQIMKRHSYWRLLYFDGFAGSGTIQTKDDEIDLLESVALQVLRIDEPRPFDMFYFVDKDQENAIILQKTINKNFPNLRNVFVSASDCNTKLLDLAKYLKKPENKDFRGVVFIDPYGMQVNWEGIESLKGLHLDLWILVPTGSAINRMLKCKNQSPDTWFISLSKFFGIPAESIKDRFYKPSQQLNLFGRTEYEKITDAVQEAANLYKERLNSVFNYVSAPLEMKNSKNAIIFHFFMASNVEVATKIANDIIRPKNN